MTTNASLFAENRDQVITPILPADVNSTVQLSTSPNVSAFTRAVNNDVKPQEPGLTSILPAVANNNDGQRLAGDAMLAGQTLRDPGQGIGAKQSDAMYLTNQVGNALSSVSTGLLGILSDEHAGNDMDGNGVPDDMEQTAKAAPLPPQMSLPSPSGFGGGMGG